MVHVTSSLLPQSDSLIQCFHRKFRLCIPGCTDLHLHIQQLNSLWGCYIFNLHHLPSLPMVQNHWECKHAFQKTVINGDLHWRKQQPYMANKKLHYFGDDHSSLKPVPFGYSACGYNSPTAKIFINTIEGPHILLNTGISMLRNYTAGCRPWPKAWRQPWSILIGLCNQRSTIIPISQKPKYRTNRFAYSNAKKVNGVEITFLNSNILHKVKERGFFFLI